MNIIQFSLFRNCIEVFFACQKSAESPVFEPIEVGKISSTCSYYAFLRIAIIRAKKPMESDVNYPLIIIKL